MAGFTPGFRGTRRERDPKLPPGQYEVHGFPVLTIGPTPTIPTSEWQLTLRGEAGATTT